MNQLRGLEKFESQKKREQLSGSRNLNVFHVELVVLGACNSCVKHAGEAAASKSAWRMEKNFQKTLLVLGFFVLDVWQLAMDLVALPIGAMNSYCCTAYKTNLRKRINSDPNARTYPKILF